MKTWVMSIAGVAALAGCSIYSAATAPPPVDYKHVEVGQSRGMVINTLGAPKYTDVQGDTKTDHFEFTSGYNPASKARIILYVAGDFFTLGAAELIFWPIELAALQGDECRGSVDYDANNHVVAYAINSRGGEALWTSPPATLAATQAAASTEAPPAATEATATPVSVE